MSSNIGWFEELHRKIIRKELNTSQRKKAIEDLERGKRLGEHWEQLCIDWNAKIGTERSIRIWDGLVELDKGHQKKAIEMLDFVRRSSKKKPS